MGVSSYFPCCHLPVPQACEEHYNLPPSAAPLHGEEEEAGHAAADRSLLGQEGDGQPADDIAAAVVGGDEAGADGEREALDPDRDTGAQAADAFDPEAHARYLALPPLRQATEEELTVRGLARPSHPEGRPVGVLRGARVQRCRATAARPCRRVHAVPPCRLLCASQPGSTLPCARARGS